MRAMALDYGEKRIGVALSDPGGTIALPHETIARGSAGLDGVLSRIHTLAQEYQIERIVVGLPIHMSGRSGPEAEAARRFGASVGDRTGIDVDFLDERWTTREAERAIPPGRGRRRRARERGEVDAMAAALILRAWLERSPA